VEEDSFSGRITPPSSPPQRLVQDVRCKFPRMAGDMVVGMRGMCGRSSQRAGHEMSCRSDKEVKNPPMAIPPSGNNSRVPYLTS
jgi:hypothetical protein